MSETVAVINEPREICGSELKTREQRAKALAGAFVKFISEHTDLLVQVRQDFLDKEKHESIMGCKTWTEYCVGVLHYSESHINSLIKGRNPAAAKHDGSKNRVYTPEPPAVPAAAAQPDEPEPEPHRTAPKSLPPPKQAADRLLRLFPAGTRTRVSITVGRTGLYYLTYESISESQIKKLAKVNL